MSKKLSLDLSNMKHVSSTKSHTTLRHRDGHSITLAHAALDPVNQKQLAALSKISDQAATPQQRDELKHKMADGGQVGQDSSNILPSDSAVDSKSGKTASGDKGLRSPAQVEKPKAAYAAGGQVDSPQTEPAYSEDQAFTIQPENFEAAQNMASGTMGAIKSVAPAAEAMAAKTLTSLPGLVEQMGAHANELADTLGAQHPLVQKAFKQLNSLKDFGNNHKSSKKFAGGGVAGQAPEALDPNAQPQPDVAAVPTNFTPTPEAQRLPEVSQDAQIYERARHNIAMSDPFASEEDIAEAALHHVAAANEDKQAAELQKQQQSLKTDSLNQQLASIGAPPIVGQQSPTPNSATTGPDQGTQQPQAPGTLQGAPQDQGLAQHQPAAGGMSQPGDPSDPAGLMQQGYQSQIKGINAQATAVGNQALDQKAALEKDMQAKTLAQEQYKSEYSQLEKERQDHIADIKDGYVDPNKYWDSHSKIASGIGMILAGFNPTSNPNAALNFLKFQMEQNLHAQERNLGAKENLLSANLKQFGNLKDAKEMTRIMQNDVLSNQLQQAAATAANPMAKAAALQAVGHLQTETAPQFLKFAAMRTIGQLANGNASPDAVGHALGYLRMVAPDQAKEISERYVPGLGLAKIPMTSEIRNKIVGHQELDTQVNDLMNFVATHKTLVPGTPDYNVGQQKALVLQSALREGKLGTVYKAGEQPLLDKLINGNPAGLLSGLKTIPQLQELSAMNQRDFHNTANSVGLSIPSRQALTPPPKGYERQIINGKSYLVPTKGK